MKRTITTMLALLILLSTEAIAIEPIKVLVAKSPGITDTEALNMLNQLNQLMANSGLSTRDFVNANTSTFVAATTCPGADHEALLVCARNLLKAKRDQYNADIVIMLVPSLSGDNCGAVPEPMVNTLTISKLNQDYAYAIVAALCPLPAFVVSHEVLHLLSIEHKRLDTKLSSPTRANHAAATGTFGTAAARPLDCGPNHTCTNFENIMSEDGRNFSNGFPAGNDLHSNAKQVVSGTSWNVVSAYRPLPEPPSCRITYEFSECNGTSAVGQVTATLPGYSVQHAEYDWRSRYSGVWYDLFEGALTCVGVSPSTVGRARAILTTAYGISQCEVIVPNTSCGGGGGGGGDPL